MSHIFLIGYNTMMHARFLMLILRSTNLPTHFYASTLWWTYYFYENCCLLFTYFNNHDKILVSFMQTIESKLSYYLIFLKYAFIWYLIRQFELFDVLSKCGPNFKINTINPIQFSFLLGCISSIPSSIKCLWIYAICQKQIFDFWQQYTLASMQFHRMMSCKVF